MRCRSGPSSFGGKMFLRVSQKTTSPIFLIHYTVSRFTSLTSVVFPIRGPRFTLTFEKKPVYLFTDIFLKNCLPLSYHHHKNKYKCTQDKYVVLIVDQIFITCFNFKILFKRLSFIKFQLGLEQVFKRVPFFQTPEPA